MAYTKITNDSNNACFRKYLFAFFAVIFAIVALSACDFSWQRYYNKQHRLSILFPANWEKKTGEYNAIVIALEPPKGLDDRFRENVSITMTELPKPLALSTYFDLNREELYAKIFPVDPSEGDILAGLLRGKYLSFQTSVEGTEIRILSAVFMKGKKVFVITCSSQVAKFAEYEPVFMRIIQSLRVR